LGERSVRRIVRTVLARERRAATISVTFVGPVTMRGLNRRYLGRDAVTDVLAFPLVGPGDALAGDVYLCAAAAAKEAKSRGISLREELIRLVVHGVLHVLGQDHPAGPDRTGSPMWRRQERYVRTLA
jgi:rRNA maturation RNase YbeY